MMSEAHDLDVTLFRALHMSTRQLTAAVERALQDTAAVSLPEYEILSALAASPDRRARPSELGEMLAWEKSRTSHQVTRMEKRGLLTRLECDADMRGNWVVVTDKGAEAVRLAGPTYHAAILAHLAGFASDEDKGMIARHLIALVRALAPVACSGEVNALETTLAGVHH